MSSKITQTDLNLAINYMVMEQVSRCMGVYDYLVEEHDWIELFFEMAAKGRLKDELLRLGEEDKKDNKNRLATLFKKLHNIFGLDGEVLSGERQINLGVAVDPNLPDVVRMSKMSMDELNDYIEKRANTYDRKIGGIQRGNIYNALPWINTIEGEQTVNELILEEVGNIGIDKNKNIKRAVSKWSKNPLGLNSLGIFIYFAEINKDNVMQKATEDTLEDTLDRIFDEVFSNIKLTEKPLKRKIKTEYDTDYVIEADPFYTTALKQNIYCLDSIIFSFLRKRNHLLLGYRQSGEKHHKYLDNVSDLLPAPLKLVDENSELLTIIYTLWTTNCDEYGGYHFDFKYARIIEYSGIEKEIQHQKKDILPILKAKIEILWEILKRKGSLGISSEEQSESYSKEHERFKQLTQEVKEIETDYIPALQRSLQLFKDNKQQWIENQIQSIEAERARLRSQLEQEKAKLSSQQEEESKSSIIEVIKTIEIKLKVLDAEQEKMEKRATGNKPIPWIKVREPYYEYITI